MPIDVPPSLERHHALRGSIPRLVLLTVAVNVTVWPKVDVPSNGVSDVLVLALPTVSRKFADARCR